MGFKTHHSNEIVELPEAITAYLDKGNLFEQVMQIEGKAFRDVPGRRTLQVQLGDQSYFIKQHFGVGWAEIFKNLLTIKLPILGAKTEKLAIHKLNEIGIATTPFVGFGERGYNPGSRESFLITKDLGNIISLEDLCLAWKKQPPPARFKREMIVAVAKLARNLHENGLNHRDFYLCHLCLDANNFETNYLEQNPIKLFLIDLHRMSIHKTPNHHDNMKDIAALYFSSMDIGLTPRDIARFKNYYLLNPLLASNNFWLNVENRANKLYAKFHSNKFQQRLSVEKSTIS